MHIDGGARGNPGPAGAGVVIATDAGERIYEGAFFLGEQTNNAAEYQALLHALQRVQPLKPATLQIRSDSELLVRQITGEYKVRNPGLQELYERAQKLLLKVGLWQIQHVRREHNRRADELANLAMDEQRDQVLFEAEEALAEESPRPTAQPQPNPGTLRGAGGGAAANPGGAPAKAERSAAAHAPGGVRVSLAHAPDAGGCPAGGPFPGEACEFANVLPAGLCAHAAHALLPTVLAVLSTKENEAATLPTMTVRCTRRACRAQFHVAPAQPRNGAAG